MKKGYYTHWLAEVEEELEKQGIQLPENMPLLRSMFAAGILPEEVPAEMAYREPVTAGAHRDRMGGPDWRGEGSPEHEEEPHEEPHEQPSARTAGSGRYFESFDKFMDDIVIRESKQPKLKTVNDSAQRKIASKYQDRPANKMRIVRK